MTDLSLAAEEDTAALGGALARCLRGGELITLRGPLGAGKTTLVRALLQALGYEGRVKSPTYTLVESYEAGGLRLHHFDLYRLEDPEALEYLGIRDFLDGHAVCLVEWPERGEGLLPEADLELVLDYGEGGRRLALHAHGEGGRRLRDCILSGSDPS
ncbi:MAG TPA: tRNA (adenosine(37)-N6)-threonylcarbamoyltransferase complex ATPase subunit type 1 TsaE [Gammaproteobacteria bacterium]|nr:tRNA (adenosine(37)-N6)-threonylcarbamoyltransferase complex ATPase subunit type 1 TsaE [Gammaproteobacteria bacterium]